MRVLIIAANTERGNMITMPIGAGLVAGAARRAGHDVRFLDLMNCVDPCGSVADAVATCDPEVIGISVRNIDDQNRELPRFLVAQIKPIVELLHLDSLRITVGIRIYPCTPLARRAVEERAIDTTDNLLAPKFYLAPGLEPWIHERLKPEHLNLPVVS